MISAPTHSPPDPVDVDVGQLDAGACCTTVVESPLTAAAAARYAAALKALADPHRLRILALLEAQPAARPLCVCDVEAAFALSQPTISHHLRVLREAGLVSVTKRGLWHYYALVPEGLRPVQTLLTRLARSAPALDGRSSI